MSIAILADTTQIARLVVPKALLLQSAQVVQSRIGGLVGREIRHIPFSRRTSSSDEILRLYRELHREIREESGVLLTTSDHMLSFKLSGLQRLVDSKTSEAEMMIRFQETLTRYSRDIIDESDFTLAVKTQLIYPVSLYASQNCLPPPPNIKARDLVFFAIKCALQWSQECFIR